jgi:5-methylcytosine-specific restriction enzyme subunit McrC
MTNPNPLELAEWGRGTVTGARLTRGDRDLIERLQTRPRAARLTIRDYGEVVSVEASGAVGVVAFEHFQVWIQPKLADGHVGLARLIRQLSGLQELAPLETLRDLELSGATLVELTAYLLVESTDAVIRRGLWADYVEREEDLAVIRGRWLVDRQWRQRYGLLDRLECRFDEHELNIRENRLLGRALRAAAPLLSHPAVAGRAAALADLFETVCDLDHDPLPVLLEPFVYHRLNEHYTDAHLLARLVLEGLGPDDILRSGRTRSFAFLVDMNKLFERFVARLLMRSISVHDRVETQRQDSIVRHTDSGKAYGAIRPDLLLTLAGGRRLPIDSKWKRYDARNVDAGDIAQMFVYAYAYSSEQPSPAALLVYPTETRAIADTALTVRSVDRVSRARLAIVGVPIRTLLDELENGASGQPTLERWRALVRATAAP